MSLALPSLDSDNRALALETEIRKLKLELLKQELDDKLLTLRTYWENKKFQNTTKIVNTKLDDEDSGAASSRPFGSVLFANVVGEFEVWHFVLLTLFVWVLISNFDQTLFLLVNSILMLFIIKFF